MKIVKTTNGSIEKEVAFNDIVVSRVYASKYQKKGMLTAELKQEVTTKTFYPQTRVNDSLSSSIFEASDFDIPKTEYKQKETRVAWVNVPANATLETVREQISKLPAANIYKILSNRPILTEEQKTGIESGNISLTEDDVANSQVVRYPDNSDEAGKLILKDGKPQYMRRVFSTDPNIEDVDLRTDIADDFYASDEIVAELQGNEHFVFSAQDLLG